MAKGSGGKNGKRQPPGENDKTSNKLQVAIQVKNRKR